MLTVVKQIIKTLIFIIFSSNECSNALHFKHCHQKDSPWSVQQCVLSQHFAPPWEPWMHLLVTCCSPLRLLFIWGGLGEVTPRHLLHYNNSLLTVFLCDKFLSIQGDLPQAYTSKRRILIEVLPVPNAYTKSGDAYIHFAKSFCCLHICIFIAISPQCVYQVYALSV